MARRKEEEEEYIDDYMEEYISDLEREKRQLERMRTLETRKEELKDDISNLRGKKVFDKNSFGNILLFISLVLLAGAIAVEGRAMARYSIILLIPIVILLWKLANKFGK